MWSRIACGRSPLGVRLGKASFVFSICVAPIISALAFGVGFEEERLLLAFVLAALSGGFWLILAGDVRNFFAGDRMSHPLSSADRGIRGIGIASTDAPMRWIAVTINVSVMTLEAWFVWNIGTLEWIF